MTALQHSTRPAFDETEQLWNALAERLEAFVAAWEGDSAPPAVSQFVPAGSPRLRRMTLAELVKVDLDYRWQRPGHERRIEDYVAEFSELAGDNLPCDLIYEEYYVRKQRGHDVSPEEYFERFPHRAEELRRLLGLDTPLLSTAVFSGIRVEEVEAGQTIDDFDLLTRLGKGAFASVFLARQKSMQRLVALKVSADRGHEPQTLAQLDHPNIVRVYDQRIMADDGIRLMYMQYVSGGALQEALDHCRMLPPSERSGRSLLEAIDRTLDRRGEMPPSESPTRHWLAAATWPEAVAWLGIQLASALDYAHRRQVLHRDLKPANILLAADATPKLVDFNISFCSKLEGATPAAYFGGSLAYMSPEQLEACSPAHDRKADSLDGRSDLYSLGVVLWELLTGTRPFRDDPAESGMGRTLAAMIERRRDGVLSAGVGRPSGCPRELVDVLLRCLSPNVDDRFASGAELARALRVCLQPTAGRLLRPNYRGWTSWVRRFPVLAMIVLAIVPNAVAGLFNLLYNWDRFPDSPVFWNTQSTVNSIAFPLGMFLCGAVCWPVAQTLARLRRGQPVDAATLQRRRQHALRLGRYAAAISIAEWLVAGVVYPIAMHLAGENMQPIDYAHFIGSLTLCGLIAAAYPFFGITVMAVRALYPALVRVESFDASDTAVLVRLHRLTWVYLVLAASLPMLGVALLVTLGGAEQRLILALLSAGGLLGFGVTFLLARVVQNDIAALLELSNETAPPTVALSTDTMRSWLKK